MTSNGRKNFMDSITRLQVFAAGGFVRNRHFIITGSANGPSKNNFVGWSCRTDDDGCLVEWGGLSYLLPRKLRIFAAISGPFSSRAKWPAS